MIDIKLPISALGLNVRAMNCLKHGSDIKTIEDLILHKEHLLKLPNLAKGTYNNIKEKLAEHDLYLNTDPKSLEVKNIRRMTGLREIEITFTVKVATYKAKEFVEIQKNILDSYMGKTYEIIGKDGVVDDGKLIISGDMK
jgi:hypothetical protein